MQEKLVLIGNGMVGVRILEEILAINPDAFAITIIGKEKYPSYNRIQLSYVLQQTSTIEDIITHPFSWYSENNVELIVDDAATKIDTTAKEVLTVSGKKIPYDKIIIATGSNPFMLPIPGVNLPEVFAFRNIDDTEGLLMTAKKSRQAVVIGGGLLGLEAAAGLHDLGLEVTVVHLMDHLMETQLDKRAAAFLRQDLEAQGLHFLLEKNSAAVLGEDHVTGLKFSDGSQIPADMVVMSIGIKPAIQLAKDSGIKTQRGIVVNEFLQTDDPNIYAVGECAEFNGVSYGLVAPLFEQAKVLAGHITGKENIKPYAGSNVFTSLKVSGCDLYSAGNILKLYNCPSLEACDQEKRQYKRLFIKDNVIQGIILYGDTAEGGRFYSMMQKQENISEFQAIALLKKEGENAEEYTVDKWPDDANVCSCNGVSKGEILYAIKEHDLHTVAEVGQYTRAGTSCGKCKPNIKILLESVLGDQVGGEGMCPCTTLSRDQVVKAIQEQHLLSTTEVYQALHFANPEGCNKCRPAINYYLNMSFPHEHEDELASRYANERMHANIQRNGTYSVIPKVRAGKTSPEQLIKIAEVAKDYKVPLVKITEGLRIGLYGVKGQDLPDVWKRLDMQSSQANAKGFRSVKSCVGKQFCRFGKQDSLGLGVKLEETYEYIDSPHKFKVGVAGCPQNCVETLTKDFGVIGVDDGFEIYIGGGGGTTTTLGQLLCKVETEEEVIEYCGALLQLYRTTGTYAQRTAPWLKDKGMDFVKGYLLDEKKRKALVQDLKDATDDSRREPWKKVVGSTDLQEKIYSLSNKERA